MHHAAGIRRRRANGTARAGRRAATLAAALLGAAAVCAPAANAATPTIVVAGDSVIVSDHSGGPTTVRATRPDAVTRQPVVIGQYAATGSSLIPFTVNTTAPIPIDPSGDCWQQGALASALTPDLQPGDTVTVTQAAPGGGEPSSASVPVTEADVKDAVGPVPVCKDIAPFARNAVTQAPKKVAGSPIVLSGVAQPFARGVSVAATDGTVSTAPVAVAPAQDGSWAATIPAGQVRRLAAGSLTVTPVFEVPDVSTGAMAHIAGPAIQVSGSGAAPGRGHRRAGVRVTSVRRPARISLGTARRTGIRTSFVVPAGAAVVRVRLERHGRTFAQRVVPGGRAGSRQSVRLRASDLRRVQHRGTYRIAVSAGPSRRRLGPPVTGPIVIH